MIKQLTFMSLVIVFASLLVRDARADLEALQETVYGPIEGVVKEATYIKDELGKIQEEIRSTVEGIAGPIKDAIATGKGAVEDAKKAAETAKNAVETAKNQVGGMVSDPIGGAQSLATGGVSFPTFDSTLPSFVKDVDNQEATSKAVTENYLAQRGSGNDTAVIQQQNEKLQIIQRENFAKIYSSAFSIRANLAKEREKEKKNVIEDCGKSGSGDTNTRCLKLAVREKSDTIARRMGRILSLELAIYDFNITQQAGLYQSKPEAEEKKKD